MNCPLCRQRKARRACPALGQQICTVCCGTKRLVEIACPSDCPYLASARDHPPARIVRQQEDDLAAIVRFMRDFNDRQSQLFFLLLTFLARYSATKSRYSELSADTYLAAELESLIDDDVAEAMAALAATYETASRGRALRAPAAVAAGRTSGERSEAAAGGGGQGGGSAFERDAAVVLRRVEAAARQALPGAPDNRRAFLDLVGRVMRAQTEQRPTRDRRTDAAPRSSCPDRRNSRRLDPLVIGNAPGLASLNDWASDRGIW